MNILRTIKTKQILGELDNLDDKEKFFFSLFDNLIEVVLYKKPLMIMLKHKDYTAPFDGPIWYFTYEKGILEYNNGTVGLKFKRKYGISESITTNFIQDTIIKYSIINFNEPNRRISVIPKNNLH